VLRAKARLAQELEVGEQDLAWQAADHQRFLAPVKLEGFAQGKAQRHEGAFGGRVRLIGAPLADELGDPGIVTVKPALLQGLE